MTAIPKVSIKIKGSADPEAEIKVSEESLFMTYFQCTKGDRRRQWIVIPPGVSALDTQDSTGRFRILGRTQEFVGNRSKWFHSQGDAFSILTAISNLDKDGWTFHSPIVVKLEVDDYRKMWTGETSHKAIRAINRAIAPYGLSIK